MKAFTNKAVGLAITTLFVAACSPETPVSQAENLPVETVEEFAVIDSPLAPAEKPAATAPAVPAAKQPASAQPARGSSSFAEKTPPHTTQYTAQELMAKLKKWEQNLNTFSADFNQVSSYDGVEINRSKGRLYYNLPEKLLRWEMLAPDGSVNQIGITNKKQIVILDDALQPVATLSWQEWQKGQPNQAIFDIGNYAQLADRHDVKVASQDATQAVLALTPKSAAENYTLFITLSKQDFFPLAVCLQSQEMLTTNELLEVRKNEPLAEELFGGFFK